MSEKSFESMTLDVETKTACYPLRLDVALAADGSLIVMLAGSTFIIPDRYTVWTGTCSQVEIAVHFPMLGGSVVVAAGTAASATYTDSDGDQSITFYRGSPDEFDVDVSLPAPKPTSLKPKPGVPSRRVRLLPKIGYPPPDVGDE